MSDSTTDPTFGNVPATDPFGAAKAEAMKKAEDLRNAAAAKFQDLRQAAGEKAQQWKQAAGDATQHAREYADKAWEQTRARTQDLAGEAEKFTREKPLQALLVAFGAGLVLGFALKR